jgi:glycosyltransferase involved in cell wall biosynthesis
MRKLKIGIMGTRGIPNQYGGFEQFAQYLSAGLVQRGHDVYVYTSHDAAYKENSWNGVQLIRCHNPEDRLGTTGQFFYDLHCINDARERDFDVLLHLGYTSDAVWYWRWPGQSIHMVNMDGLEWKRSKYNGPTRLFLKWAERLAAKKAQVLIADSLPVQEYLQTKYGKTAAYLSYGARVFTQPDASVPAKYGLASGGYFLLVARMEPENNIEMIIRGYLDSQYSRSLVIIGNINNKYGKYISTAFRHPGIRFTGSLYEQYELNNLRYYSAKYFHGHSVGGTNPSLLEAMACGCAVAAHDNVFNKAVLQNDADYFSTIAGVAAILNSSTDPAITHQRKQANMEKIRTVYDMEKNISDYEQLFLDACREKVSIRESPAAETV